MFKKIFIVVLMVLFISKAFAGEIITVSGNLSHAYGDKIHMEVAGKFMEIEKVPQNVMKKIWKLDRNATITLKIKKNNEKQIFVSLEKK